MTLKTEHQSQYYRYTPEEIKRCRAHSIKNPETLHLICQPEMNNGYGSSFICYPLVDRSSSILPRDAFKASDKDGDTHFNFRKAPSAPLQLTEKIPIPPSEYKHEFIQFPIEKAHSIPQLSHIKWHGDFIGIPEYRDSYRMYDNYSKSAPIKKADNLTLPAYDDSEKIPEYREKFQQPQFFTRERPIKVNDHLYPRGEFSKSLPEYFESFRDPQVRGKPERGTCREPFLRLRGKIEFNPEYQSNFLDYPRSRPVVKKATTSIRFSNSTSPNRYVEVDNILPLTLQPEYRRAQYNYQVRERSPRKEGSPESVRGKARENVNLSRRTPKRPTSRLRRTSSTTSINELKSQQEHYDNVTSSKKPIKYGRRASPNAEDRPITDKTLKYTHRKKIEIETSNRQKDYETFIVLKDPCKKIVWMNKSWYES